MHRTMPRVRGTLPPDDALYAAVRRESIHIPLCFLGFLLELHADATSLSVQPVFAIISLRLTVSKPVAEQPKTGTAGSNGCGPRAGYRDSGGIAGSVTPESSAAAPGTDKRTLNCAGRILPAGNLNSPASKQRASSGECSARAMSPTVHARIDVQVFATVMPNTPVGHRHAVGTVDMVESDWVTAHRLIQLMR